MNKRKELKDEYKNAKSIMCIYQIKIINNEKVFLGKSLNLNRAINSARFQLKLNSHKNKELQDIWNKLGEKSFVFEVLESIEAENDDMMKNKDNLNLLQEIWLEKLKPNVEKEYK